MKLIWLFVRCLWRFVFPKSWHIPRPGTGYRLELDVLEGRWVPSGSWTELTSQAKDSSGSVINASTMLLLTDGNVLAQGAASPTDTLSNKWSILAPDDQGNYADGTWSPAASMNTARQYYASNVLPNGNVLVIGGEGWSNTGGAGTDSNTYEVYSPTSNSWSTPANFPESAFGDDPTELLPNGQVLGGYLNGPQTFLYSPATNSWTETGRPAPQMATW